MSEKHYNYPTDEQLSRLYSFLTFLKNDKMYWRTVELRGSTIIIKVEPPKGDFDIRIFKINEEGEIDDDEFREQIQRFD